MRLQIDILKKVADFNLWTYEKIVFAGQHIFKQLLKYILQVLMPTRWFLVCVDDKKFTSYIYLYYVSVIDRYRDVGKCLREPCKKASF
jgi:hypothetical protein